MDAAPCTIERVMTSTALTIADLNTKVNHEPRILDVRLAETLGYARPADIRPLIERHRVALEGLGSIIRTVRKNAGKGRPAYEFWLTKKQALYICTKAETAKATEATIIMVEVFDAWQSGHLTTIAPPPLAPGLMMMMIGQRQIVVDANDYAIGAGDEAVVCDAAGKVTLHRGPLTPNTTSPWLGKRSVAGHWRKSKTPGIDRERGYFTVLGRLIQPGERRRRMIAA